MGRGRPKLPDLPYRPPTPEERRLGLFFRCAGCARDWSLAQRHGRFGTRCLNCGRGLRRVEREAQPEVDVGPEIDAGTQNVDELVAGLGRRGRIERNRQRDIATPSPEMAEIPSRAEAVRQIAALVKGAENNDVIEATAVDVSEARAKRTASRVRRKNT